jgi:uncharacterized protein (UPF0335 family)
MTNNQLADIVSRIEKLEDDRALLAQDIKDILLEAKSSGFEPKLIKKVVTMRRMDKDKREAEEALLQTYMAALGMLSDTPLGQAAIARAQKGDE